MTMSYIGARPAAAAGAYNRAGVWLPNNIAQRVSTNTWRDVRSYVGESQSNPASSPRQILSQFPNAPDGAYWLNHGSGAYQAYCWMSGGGYILVAKISSAQNGGWMWDGSYWSATQAVGSVADLTDADAVGRGYYEYSMDTGMRMCLGSNPLGNWLVEAKTGSNPRLFFNNAGSSLNGRGEFMSWVINGAGDNGWSSNLNSCQPNCNHTGFATGGGSGSNIYRFRWGWSGNNEADCNTNDSNMGFGCYHNNGNPLASGGRATHCSAITRYATGYIFAK